jgi:hypothetical protein
MHHNNWYQLLLHYLYDTRHRHPSLDASTALTKKKRKKKKKKKAIIIESTMDGVSPAVEFHESATSWYDPMEDEEEELPVKNHHSMGGPLNTAAAGPSPFVQQDTGLSVFEKEQRLQQERMRRIHRILHQFLDTTAEGDTSLELSLHSLHTFVATIRDDESVGTDTIRSSEIGNLPITLLNRKQIELALQNIQCGACRRDVERILLPSLSKTKVLYPRQLFLQSLVIPTIYDDDWGEMEIDECQATQYQSLMEEGRSPPEHLQYWSLDLQVSEEGEELVGWQIRRPHVTRQAERSSANGGSPDGWSMADLEFLLKHYVLLLGLPPDEFDASHSMAVSSNDVAEIAKQVAFRSSRITDQFRDMTFQIEAALENFHRVNSLATECVVEWHTYQAKIDLDQVCCVALNTLLAINLEITQTVHRMLSHCRSFVTTIALDHTEVSSARDEAGAECQWALGHCRAMWKAFVEGCSHIQRDHQAYEDQLFALADERTGSLPDMLVSPAARHLYSAFVESKVVRVIQTLRVMDEHLNAPTYMGGWHNCCSTNIKTRFMVRLFTEDLFINFVAIIHDEPTDVRLRMDQTFEDVLRTVGEMTDTVQERTVAMVHSKHQQVCAKLHRLFMKVCDDMDFSEGIAVQELRLLVEELQTIDWQEDVHRAVNELESGLLKAIDVWIKYRLDYVVAGYETRTVMVMPYDLRRSMIKGAALHEESQQCRGGNEQHRAICVLVALFFEQLAERFQEWQAFRAEQELLKTMENDLAIVSSVPVSNKVNKKPKKKGKKSTLLDETKEVPKVAKGNRSTTPVKNVPLCAEDDSIYALPPEPLMTVDSAANGPSDKTLDVVVDDRNFETEMKRAPTPESGNPSTVCAINHPIHATINCNEDGGDGDEESESNGALVASKELYQHHHQGSNSHMPVGVHGASGFVSAEDFFVSRLIQIIKSEAVLVIQSKSM